MMGARSSERGNANLSLTFTRSIFCGAVESGWAGGWVGQDRAEEHCFRVSESRASSSNDLQAMLESGEGWQTATVSTAVPVSGQLPACLEVKNKALQGEAEHGRQGAQLQLARGIHLQQHQQGQWRHQVASAMDLITR